MTNVNNPTGGKAVGSFNAARFDLKVNRYVTSISDTTPLYRGDAVKTTGTAAVDGTPVCAKALAGESIRGLVVAIEPLHTEENSVYRKASTERIIHVCDDPYIMLEIQTNGTLAITDIGKYANIVLNGGNDITGLSGTLVDLSSTSTDSRQLRIVSLVDRVDNEVGQYAKVRCVIHDHELAHGGTYTQENIWKRVGTTISPFTTGDDVDTLTGNLRVGGKLTVVGLIDPTGLLLDPQAAAPGTDDGMIYYDLPSNNFLFRENGAWHTLDDTGVWKRVTGTPNYLLPLVVADDIGATAARITKGWFADLEITNYPSVNGTALSDQYLATTNSPTFVGETLSGLSVLGGIVQTDGSGVLSSSITLPDGTLATTQSPLDNSTKLATTAYVDAAVVVEDLWDRAGTTLSPSTANDDVLITKSTSTATDYTLKTNTTLLADVDGVIGHISEMTAYASGMTGGKEIVAYEAILNHSASDTNGQYIAYRAADFSDTYPSATSPSYGFWCGRDYDWGLYLESGRILINDDSPDIISCARETDGDGPSLTISASAGRSSGAPQDGGDFILEGGFAENAGTPGEIIFHIQTTDVAKFNSDGNFELTSGTDINEIVTSISVASTDDQAATAKAVWDLHALTDTWNEVMHFGNTFTIADTENISATITQNDTTNNPAALIIANTGSGNDITLPNSSYIKNGLLVLGGDVGLTGTRVNKGWFADIDTTGLSVTGLSTGIVQAGGTGTFSSSLTLPDGTLATTQSPLDNSTKLATTAYVDAAVVVENIWDRVTGTPNYVIPNTGADDVGATGLRITKIWATDIESTNMPTVGGTSINANAVLDLTSQIVTQLSNIGATTISSTQFGYLGNQNQEVATTATPTFAQLTVDNLVLDGNTLSSTSGNINITPDNPADHIIINSHWDFDGKTLVAISDSDTTLTAYAGKNITIEGVTFDGGVVAAITDLTVDTININGDTIAATSALTLTSGATSDITLTAGATSGSIVLNAGLNSFVTIDNVQIYSSTVETTAGDLSLKPVAGASVIIDSHFGFDGTVLTALTDANTTITAYVGKNVTIEGVTIDGGVVAGITDLTVENITVSKGYTGSVTTVNAITYDLLTTDYILNVTYTVTGACAISLPSAQALVGRIIHIKDRGGNASVNNILISPAGGRTIDGAATVTITGDYESLAIYSDGTNWYIF